MNPILAYATKFLLLFLILFLYKFSFKNVSLKIILLAPFLLLTPLFHFWHPHIIINFLPFITLLCLFIIIRNKTKNFLIPALALAFVFLANLYTLKILTFPFHFQSGNTIFANWHIAESIVQHQQDALYLPFTLRPVLFNQLVYLFFTLSNTSYFLSLSNLYHVFLILNLYPLLTGILQVHSNRPVQEKIFIFGSLLITFLIMGFSRPVQETTSLLVISPILIYLILLGLEKINLKIYLFLALLTFFIQTGNYP